MTQGEELHRRIGVLALRRNYLSPDKLFEAWQWVGRQPNLSPYEVWVQTRLLDRSELAEILYVLGAQGDQPHGLAVAQDQTLPDGVSDDSHESIDLADVMETIADDGPSEEDEDHLREPGKIGGHGRYLLGAKLGSGGVGVVYRAFDRVVGRSVAMKLLHKPNPSPEAIARFMEEAQATGQLEHPGIVPVYDVGQFDDGRVFYTMKRLRSNSLRRVLRGLSHEDQTIVEAYGQGRLLSIFLQVCRAVQYAHDRGVIHRDLKPDNIMLGDYGEVHVMDWGLALITKAGVITERSLDRKKDPKGGLETYGTPAYMSPEQARGDLSDITALSDVYSLGVILYELITLQQPIRRATILETMMAVLHDAITPPSEVSGDRPVHQELERIVMQALEKDPRKRWQSVSQMHDALERFLDGRSERDAERHLHEGERSIRVYEQALEEVGKLSVAIRELSARIAEHEPVERKRPLWELQDQHEAAHAKMISAFNAAYRELNHSLAHMPNFSSAKSRLARLFWSRYQLAVAERSLSDQLTFEAYLRQVDDGTWLRLLDEPAKITLTTEPEEAVVFLHPYGTSARVRVPLAGQFVGTTPLELKLERGPWLLRIKRAGSPLVSMPIQVSNSDPRHLHAWLPERNLIPPGAVHITGGPARLGGDKEAVDSLAVTEVNITPFLMKQYPVTFQEYCDFLNDLARTDPALAQQRAPRTRDADGALTQLSEDGLYQPHPILIEGPMRAFYPEGEGAEWCLPVLAVSYDDALAYAAWLAERDGIPWRLPTELEWEYAARGGDERLFPWGDRFDATFCKMNASRGVPSQPEPVGAFPIDRSEFGVCDMAGGVREWTLAESEDAQEIILRGGAWSFDARLCRLASRSRSLRDVRLSVNGFRLAASYPK